MWPLFGRVRSLLDRRPAASVRSRSARRRALSLEGLESRLALSRWYVNASAMGANTGETWADAFMSLQEALNFVGFDGEEIWVARGTYRPTDLDDRTMSFDLHDGLALYGGFA